MKHSVQLFAALAVASFVGSASAQTTLTPLFKLDDTAAGSPTWLNAGDGTRGCDYNPATGNLLVADRDASGNVVRRLNGVTGAEVTPNLDGSGYSGGTFPLNKVLVADDGAIYVVNLANGTAAAASTLKIYKHASEAAAGPATNAYTETVSVRWGDDAAVTGSGNTTRLVVSGAGGNLTLAIFTTADAGNTFTKAATITPSNPALLGTSNLAWDLDGQDIWVRKSAATNTEVTTGVLYNESTGASLGQTAGIAAGGPIDMGTVHSLAVQGVGPAAASGANVLGRLVNVANNAVTWQSQPLERGASGATAGTAIANGNGAGDVSISSADNRVYFLYTNNSVSGWNIPAPSSSVGDWNLYN